MNINRDYLLILDVKSGNLTVPTMYFINTDRGTSNIYLQLIVKNTDIKVSPLENATNYKVKANIVKSGGIIKFIEGVLVNEEDAIYEFNLPVDCINLSGAYRIEFEVSADVGEKQESITSFSTKYYVKRSILAEINEEIEDGDDYPLIVKLLAKIEELEKDSETRWIAENERIANEELRVQAESERLARYTLAEEKEAQRVIDEEARINAENERLAKEEERIAKEIDRVAKETERLNEEEIRKGSEITRVLNETTRVTNEEARVEAENIRLPKYLEAEEKEQARLIAEEERIANEELRVSNENDRKTAEAIRDSKEADRLNSEVFRLTNEVNRLENEKLRTNNEATRINSELTRVDNERNRVVSEKARVNSEEIRKTNENNRKIYESNREKAEQLRESNEVVRQEGYTLMREQINNLDTTLSDYALKSYVDNEISKMEVESYTHPSTHPASMITGLSTVATSGSYNDLVDKPTIPTNTSEMTNDSNFITIDDVHTHNNKDIIDTITQTTMNTISSAVTYKGIIQSSGDVNNCTTTGFYKIQQGVSNLPVNEDSFLMVYNESSSLVQLWYSSTSDRQRIRRKNNDTWGDWYVVYTEKEPQDLSAYAPINAPNFEGSISLDRKSGTVVGKRSIAIGYNTEAADNNTQAFGYQTKALATGSHAEGNTTIANARYSHTEGYRTIASGENQHVQGKYNIEDTTSTYAHIVGNGTSDTARNNAHTLDWNGNAWFNGNVSVNGTPTNDNDLVTKKYVDNLTNNIEGFWYGTQAEYDAIITKNENVIYFIKEGEV